MEDGTGSEPVDWPQRKVDGDVQPLSVRSFSQDPVMILAFSGWNDAGGAATAALTHLAEVFSAEMVSEIDSEDYVDFQVNRPMIEFDGSTRRAFVWPDTKFLVAHSWANNRRLIFVQGVEPSLRWKSYCSEILTIGKELGAKSLICVGALLSDSPHSRPLEVSVTTSNPELQNEYGIGASSYEGPAGIISVLSHAAELSGLGVVNAWGSVPHYVANAPSPKATAALMSKVEILLGEPVDRYELDEEAIAWEAGVNVLAAQDPDIAAYVKELEQQADATELPQASGDSIAKEFEQYLKRRGDEVL